MLIGFTVALIMAAVPFKAGAGHPDAPQVRLLKTPGGGIQPQAVLDSKGVLHLIYFSGEPAAGDVFYVRREPGAAQFSAPIRVNSQPGSVIAIGTIRGAHIAIGKAGRVHVAWMGSKDAQPRGPNNEAPMLYARLNDAKTAFEPQRNVMQFSGGLDGGGSVAADQEGNVYVTWHGRGSPKGEAHRRVWLARSTDDGRSFARETAAFSEGTGACGCCGMRAYADRRGNLSILYRAATEEVHRDMMLLTSADRAKSFAGRRIDQWQLSVCPMSTAAIAGDGKATLLAWETAGQVYYSRFETTAGKSAVPIAAPGEGGTRKHPAIAANAEGKTILVWTEGTAWKRGGSLAWQVFDEEGKATRDKGEAAGVPVWGLAAVIAEPDGSFTIIY
jgi:hypothetical protein